MTDNTDPRLAPWTTISHDTALETPWFKIGKYAMRTAKGTDATYYIHEPRDAVICVCVTDDNQILIERQYRPPLGRVSTDYPSGLMEADDASSFKAMERELAEEVGYKATSIEQLAVIDKDPGFSSGRVHVFLARGSIQMKATPEPTESIVAEFVPASQILHMVQAGEITCTFCVSATFFAFQKLGLLTAHDAS